VVDRFQGHECDIIILDLVSSGPRIGLGFMSSPNRMNVALSRQKRLLVIVGDYQGTINVKPGRNARREKAPLQEYLAKLDPAWVIPAEHIDKAIP
jgi:superfamily I DNA and/or RNA helicase